MNIEELKKRPVWCLARCTQDGADAWQKQPYTLQGNVWKRGGQNKKGNLVPYAVADAEVKRLGSSAYYLGLVLVDILCIDIDHINPDAQIVKDILQQTGAYADASVSGNGVHIYGIGNLPEDKTQLKQPLDSYGYPGSVFEVYTCKNDADAISSARFMVFTEKTLPQCGNELPDLTSIIRQYCGSDAPKSSEIQYIPVDASNGALSWDSKFYYNPQADYMQRVQWRCNNDAYFKELWTGAVRDGAYIQDGKQVLPRASSSDKSESTTDLQLMTRLMYVTRGNADASLKLYESSPYFSGKDSTRREKHQRAEYVKSLVDKALNYYQQHPSNNTSQGNMMHQSNTSQGNMMHQSNTSQGNTMHQSNTSQGNMMHQDSEARRNSVEAILQQSSLSYRLEHYEESLQQENTIQIATGISALDDFTQGGLYSGLHFLGALPGKGKTALTLQIALNVARQHQPVFYFTFEASGTEITSRLLLFEGYVHGHFSDDATDNEFMDALHWGTYQGYTTLSGGERKHLDSASSVLQNICHNLFVIEFGADAIPDVSNEIDYMQCVLEDYTHTHPGEPPALVVVDYLQLISASQGSTAKEGVDATLKRLHYLAKHQCNAVYLVISNFNRDSYTQRPTFASFKESGSIEYFGDTVMTMFPASLMDVNGVNPQDKAVAAQANAGAGSPKDIDEQGNKLVALDMLKNRRGKTGTAAILHFDAKHGYFTSSSYGAYIEGKKKQQKKRTV